MTTALVTGASGALGAVVTSQLRARGRYRVIAAGSRSGPGCDLQLDMRDREGVRSALAEQRPDVVVHLAATFGGDFDEAFAVNVSAARHLLEAVQHAGRPVRVVLAGSAAEYGAVRPDENPIRVDHVLAPVSVYGVTKAWQTQLATVYASRGVHVVVARIFNLDGPDLSERLFIGRLQRQIAAVQAARQAVIELGPLSAVRDYVSTTDAARQIIAIAERGEAGRIYHVASGVPVSMRDVLARYLSASGLDASIVREGEALSNRSGYDVPVIYADMSGTQPLLKD